MKNNLAAWSHWFDPVFSAKLNNKEKIHNMTSFEIILCLFLKATPNE